MRASRTNRKAPARITKWILWLDCFDNRFQGQEINFQYQFPKLAVFCKHAAQFIDQCSALALTKCSCRSCARSSYFCPGQFKDYWRHFRCIRSYSE